MNDVATSCCVSNCSCIREKIDRAEALMKEYGNVIEIPTVHHFAKGTYAREIHIPKGTLLTGKIHKTEHLNIISKGDISVMTEHGPMRVQAPFTMVSPPGTKRIGYAHEDTVWTTIHGTEETDLEKLEDQLIATDYEQSGVIDLAPVMEEIPWRG